MTHLSLFSGIGGIDFAAKQCGIDTIQMVELDPFCQKILAKNFPGVPIHGDIKTFDAKPFQGRATLITAGNPCQSFSTAGKQRGLNDERGQLLIETIRVTSECNPDFLLIENSPNIINLAGDWIASQLEGIQYQILACPIIPACLLGAKFKGERAFIVAAPNDRCAVMRRVWTLRANEAISELRDNLAGRVQESNIGQWRHQQPRPDGVAYGVPNRVDRLKSLGNTVNPQQVYPILQAIKEAHKSE